VLQARRPTPPTSVSIGQAGHVNVAAAQTNQACGCNDDARMEGAHA